MSGVTSIGFEINGRPIAFKMTFDGDCAPDKDMIQELQAHGCCEPEVAHLMARTVRPGDYVIDGGANVGFFTLLLSQLVGPTGFVLAFEPGENNLWKLEANIKLNSAANVQIERKALWYTNKSVALHMCEDGSKDALSAHDGSRGAAACEGIMLDEYLPASFRLLKLDIEGAEEAALRGAEALLRDNACSYVVTELNVEAMPKLGSSIETLRAFMRERGYDPFLLHANDMLPTYVPRETKISTFNARSNLYKLNFNVLFSTFDMVAAAWPEATVC